MNTGRYALAAAGFTYESTDGVLGFGGESAPGTIVGNTESYDGSAWTELNDLNTARRVFAGAGIYTSALAFGGYPVPSFSPGSRAITEEWNGSSWTEVADLNTGRNLIAGCGATAEACLVFAGENGSTDNFALTEEWNGSAWTEVGDLNTARNNLPGTGTAESALGSGGYVQGSGTNSGLCESWNGSSWTEVADLNTNRSGAGAVAGPDNESAMIFAGYPNESGKTEDWNGSSWKEIADLSVARQIPGGGGTKTKSICFAGQSPAPTNITTTEEWSGSSNTIKVLTD